MSAVAPPAASRLKRREVVGKKRRPKEDRDLIHRRQIANSSPTPAQILSLEKTRQQPASARVRPVPSRASRRKAAGGRRSTIGLTDEHFPEETLTMKKTLRLFPALLLLLSAQLTPAARAVAGRGRAPDRLRRGGGRSPRRAHGGGCTP